jgi:hypothetical protein
VAGIEDIDLVYISKKIMQNRCPLKKRKPIAIDKYDIIITILSKY